MQPYSNSLLSTACHGGGNQAHSGLLAKANTENYEELFGVLLKMSKSVEEIQKFVYTMFFQELEK